MMTFNVGTLTRLCGDCGLEISLEIGDCPKCKNIVRLFKGRIKVYDLSSMLFGLISLLGTIAGVIYWMINFSF